MLQENSTAQSEAEKRVISVKTKAGHPVKYSGNPAELPGARYETGLALRRAGAFQMLLKIMHPDLRVARCVLKTSTTFRSSSNS